MSTLWMGWIREYIVMVKHARIEMIVSILITVYLVQCLDGITVCLAALALVHLLVVVNDTDLLK